MKRSILGGNEAMPGVGRVSPRSDGNSSLPLLGRVEKERSLKPKSCFAIYFGSVFPPRIETKTMDLHHQEQLEEGGGSGGASLVAGMCWREEGSVTGEAV